VAAQRNLLNAKSVWSLPDGTYKDRKYLSLEVRNGGASRAWAFRYTKPGGGKGRINIGPLAKVKLADARSIADKFTGWLANDKDPAVEHVSAWAAAAVSTYGSIRRDILWTSHAPIAARRPRWACRSTNCKISPRRQYRWPAM
jgi:hypothetical protein